MPPQGVFGPGVKAVALDPPAMGISCPGADPRCSTAYSQMYAALGGAGHAVANLRKKYEVTGRVAFVGFSAAHGMLNALLNDPTNRAATSAVVLLDATFGGGKSGYVAAAKAAAAGDMLLAVATSDKGSKDPLTNGDYAWREFVLDPAGLSDLSKIAARAPMPEPDLGAYGRGDLVWYRFSHKQLPHQGMGKILKPFLQATLVPYWAGAGGSAGLAGTEGGAPGWLKALLSLFGFGAALWGFKKVSDSRREEE